MKMKKRFLGILLSLVMVVGLLPGMSLTALAYDGNPYASLVGKTTTVTFNGKPWYIIADNSTAVDAGTVTLLAADTSFGLSAFSSNWSNNYSSSTVKGVLDALTAEGGAFASVKDAIADTDLLDVGVTGAKLYLLSTSEAQALSSAVRKMSFSNMMVGWWLRSGGLQSYDVAYVDGEYGDVCDDGRVLMQFGVRPALKLNLSSVIFSSESKTFTVGSAVAVTSVSLDPGEVQTITVGQTLKITADVDPDNATNKKVKWSASSADVALYSDEACTIPVGTDATEILIVYAKGMSAGFAAVYADSDENPDKNSHVNIIVNAATVPVTGVTLDKTTATLTVGDDAVALTANVEPNDATDRKVKWSVGGDNAGAVALYSDQACTQQVGADATNTRTVYAKGISAGNATVTATSNADETKSAVCVVTVSKADPVYVTPTGLSAFVGQTLADVALPTANNGTWSWEEDTTTKLNDIGMTTYHAKFTPNDTDKYNIIENIEVQIQVTEKPFAVPATVTANSRTYDGTEKPLVNVDDSTLVGGTMQYALGTKDAATGTYSASIPTATDAGTYYVWYKAVGDENHIDSEAKCIEATIALDDSKTVAPKEQTLTSNGTPQPLVKPGSIEGDTGTLFYALGSDAVTAPTDGWSTEVPTATNAGTYYVWYKVEGDANHNNVDPACIVVTIAEAAKPEQPAAAPAAAPAASTSDYTLLASLKTSGKKALKMSWTAVPDAQGYDIFFGQCNTGECHYLDSTNAQSYKIKGLKKGNAYKAFVRAWKMAGSEKVYIGEASPDVHAIAGGRSNKYTNPKKISVKKKKLTVGVGKTKAIKAKLKKFSDSREYLNHVAKVRYFSSDRNVATVSANGRVTGVGVGKCTVYAVAENGLRVGVTVTVK